MTTLKVRFFKNDRLVYIMHFDVSSIEYVTAIVTEAAAMGLTVEFY